LYITGDAPNHISLLELTNRFHTVVDTSIDYKHTQNRSRVCTVVHYAALEAIRAVYGIWQIWPLCKQKTTKDIEKPSSIYHYVVESSSHAKFDKDRL